MVTKSVVLGCAGEIGAIVVINKIWSYLVMLALLNSSEMLHSHSLPGPGGPISYLVLSYLPGVVGRH